MRLFRSVMILGLFSMMGCGGGEETSGTGGTSVTQDPPNVTPTPTPSPQTTTDAGTTPPVTTTTTPDVGTTAPPTATPTPGNKIKHVFVIAMENEPAAAIYGSSAAPYINSALLPKYARSEAFTDPLADGVPSEPHYVWMEAATNKFSDTTFTSDSDPSASNSTKNTDHVVAQMRAANPPVSWLSFQEGLSASTGACPVRSSGLYAAKHDPFVFFQDVAGSPPSQTNAYCAEHHRAYTTASFATALSENAVASYNFITPNVCNDMHGGSGCPAGDPITVGDTWLRDNLPPLIDFVNANDGVIFIVWDEPVGGSNLIPFLAIGPHVKAGYSSKVAYTHTSLTKSLEEIFGLPVLPLAAPANDFADVFEPGFFP